MFRNVSDPNTELYFELFVHVLEHAQRRLQRELGSVIRAVKRPRELLEGPPLFDFFTRLILECQGRIRKLAGRRTTDAWVLASRRHLACEILSREPVDGVPMLRPDEHEALATFHVAVGYWSRPGNTYLPDREQTHELDFTSDVVADTHVLLGLCRTYNQLQSQRRTTLIHGTRLGEDPLPTVSIPTELQARIDAFMARATGPQMFATSGLGTSPMAADNEDMIALGEKLDERRAWQHLLTGALRHFSSQDHTQPFRTPSGVLPFCVSIVDFGQVVDALDVVGESLLANPEVGVSPIEIVAPFLSLAHLFNNRIEAPDSIAFYTLQARAVFTIEERYAIDRIEHNLPFILECFEVDPQKWDAGSMTRAWVERFVAHPTPRRFCQSTDGIELGRILPLVLSAADKWLVDFHIYPRAFSSLVRRSRLRGDVDSTKGRRFEAYVRQQLMRAVPGARVVETLEGKEVRDGRNNLGDLDVCIAVGSTVLAVECKSWRYQGTESCMTYDAAETCTRKRFEHLVTVVKKQFRRAEALASGSSNLIVPEGIERIIPILATPIPEPVEVFFDDDELFLERPSTLTILDPHQLAKLVRLWDERGVPKVGCAVRAKSE